MILADTNAWLRLAIHLKEPDPEFSRLVVDGTIVTHPWVLAELALGGTRTQTLALLAELTALPVAPFEEVMTFIKRYRPTGLGFVDVNLLVSALNEGADILTFDVDLRRNAAMHGRAADLPR